MKKQMLLLCLFALCGFSLCCITPEKLLWLEDPVGNELLITGISRLSAAATLVIICLQTGQKDLFFHPEQLTIRTLLWCTPCALVAFANFPFHALLTGQAAIIRTEYIGLFILSCFAVASVEELLFRGILLSSFMQHKPDKLLAPILLASGLFALSHLLHLWAGAGLGATLLQVCYTFLLGIMLSFLTVRTKHIFPAILLHTVFNIGGQIVPVLGRGSFQDPVFWAATVICGLGCALHLLHSLQTQKTS